VLVAEVPVPVLPAVPVVAPAPVVIEASRVEVVVVVVSGVEHEENTSANAATAGIVRRSFFIIVC
jgi:hypothetical protein